MNETVLDKLFADGEVKLPVLPAVAMKVLNILEDDNFSIDKLATAISINPLLTAQTLKIVNSPLFAAGQKIESIERAITHLGADKLKDIVLSFVILEELKNYKGGFDYDLFWRVSVTTAVIASTLAKILKINKSEIFVATLLKDIGIILMFFAKEDSYKQVMAEHPIHEIEIAKTEEKIFGFNHATVGMELLKRWNLPVSIYMPIGYHTSTSEVPDEYRETVKLLQLSTLVSTLFNDKRNMTAINLVKIKKVFQEQLGLENYELIKLLDDMAEKSIDVLQTYQVSIGDMKPYSQILQDSHEEVCSLNSAYENLMVELEQSRETAKDLADKFSSVNRELETMAYKDSLTGLYNHRFFHEMFDKEISSANRHSKVFSLVTFDLDGFKPINDTLGHKFGDNVLKEISNIVIKTLREEDLAFRIGGDEFAILLPDTALKGGVIIAQRLRMAVEKEGDKFKNSTQLAFTISVGVGAYLATDKEGAKEHLMHAVDKALYRSKEEGKNRVTAVG